MMPPPELRAVLRQADVLLVVPPSAHLHQPLLGVHLLQAIGRRAGFEVQVLYANLFFGAYFGEATHDLVSDALSRVLGCERLFARAAYGGPALGRDGGAGLESELAAVRRCTAGAWKDLDVAAFRALEARMLAWLDLIVDAVSAVGYPVVGCTTCYEQNAFSIALLSALKARASGMVTVLGGANCEGEMSDGLCSLTNAVDYIFSGDSEQTFLDFISDLRAGKRPRDRIIRGAPCHNLDSLPTPDYHDYHVQLSAFLPVGSRRGRGFTFLPYETSRGCWWGETTHCTFCGISGNAMSSRERSVERILEQLKELVDRSAPGRPLVYMVDKIIPLRWFRELLPRIADEVPGIAFFFAFKASATLDEVCIMKRAGVIEAQPGIEVLSTGLLRAMGKGTTVAHNLAVMRYARAVGMSLNWSLLFGFPGESAVAYRETLDLLPLIHHLPPPWGVCPVRLHRFSPYVDEPERYGIRDRRPKAFYRDVLPEHADIEKLAYYYDGDYSTILDVEPTLLTRIKDEVGRWQRNVAASPEPTLRLRRVGASRFELVDTRGLPGHPETHTLDSAEVEVFMVPRRVGAIPRDRYGFALAHHLVVERDGRLLPLVVAEADLLREFEQRPRITVV